MHRQLLPISLGLTVAFVLLVSCAPAAAPTPTVPAPTPTATETEPPPTATVVPSPIGTRPPAPTPTATSVLGPAPHTVLLDPQALLALKARARANDAQIVPALKKLLADANSALQVLPLSVTDKEQTAPSGDKHDFLSQAPYWWPDPSKPKGLPYINRDGEHNPEVDKIPDEANLARMVDATETLALAYYYGGDERYAGRAALLLRVWFLDPATRMNPNMTYAQFIPGRSEASGLGIISSHDLARVPDSAGLLAGSRAWADADQQGLRAWFSAYLSWLQTSPEGKSEAAETNNHGTWYDVQLVACALFLGQSDVAQQAALASRAARIARQIEPDGKQPLELSRTKSWDYSLFNLQAMFELAALAERAGAELWNFKTSDGRGIRAAFDYVVPFAFNQKQWTNKQIVPWSNAVLAPLLYQAALKYKNPAYLGVYRQIDADKAAADRVNLMYAAGGGP